MRLGLRARWEGVEFLGVAISMLLRAGGRGACFGVSRSPWLIVACWMSNCTEQKHRIQAKS